MSRYLRVEALRMMLEEDQSHIDVGDFCHANSSLNDNTHRKGGKQNISSLLKTPFTTFCLHHLSTKDCLALTFRPWATHLLIEARLILNSSMTFLLAIRSTTSE